MSDFNIEHFGKRLAACRDAMGLKQADFSELLGCTNGAYSLYERGKRQPSMQILDTLCQDFGLSLDFLISCRSPSPELFSERLSVAMSRHPDKSLKHLFSDSGIDEHADAIYITGAGVPNSKTLRRISSYFNCSIDYLTGASDFISGTAAFSVSVPTVRIDRNPFDDLSDEQRTVIETTLKAFRDTNAAKAQEA